MEKYDPKAEFERSIASVPGAQALIDSIEARDRAAEFKEMFYGTALEGLDG